MTTKLCWQAPRGGSGLNQQGPAVCHSESVHTLSFQNQNTDEVSRARTVPRAAWWRRVETGTCAWRTAEQRVHAALPCTASPPSIRFRFSFSHLQWRLFIRVIEKHSGGWDDDGTTLLLGLTLWSTNWRRRHAALAPVQRQKCSETGWGAPTATRQPLDELLHMLYVGYTGMHGFCRWGCSSEMSGRSTPAGGGPVVKKKQVQRVGANYWNGEWICRSS